MRRLQARPGTISDGKSKLEWFVRSLLALCAAISVLEGASDSNPKSQDPCSDLGRWTGDERWVGDVPWVDRHGLDWFWRTCRPCVGERDGERERREIYEVGLGLFSDWYTGVDVGCHRSGTGLMVRDRRKVVKGGRRSQTEWTAERKLYSQ